MGWYVQTAKYYPGLVKIINFFIAFLVLVVVCLVTIPSFMMVNYRSAKAAGKLGSEIRFAGPRATGNGEERGFGLYARGTRVENPVSPAQADMNIPDEVKGDYGFKTAGCYRPHPIKRGLPLGKSY